MARDHELDRLKQEEQEAFRRKQAAWDRLVKARELTDAAHDEMERAWEKRLNAREIMNREFEAMKSAREVADDVWGEYKRIREANSYQIDSLRAEADREHEEMIRCFEQASTEYECGDKSMAPVYSEEGHQHQDRRNELNAEVHDLIQEIRDAKQHAEWTAPNSSGSSFSSAKAEFESAKAEHEALQARFKRFKEDRDRYKAEFDAAKAEHERLKEEFHKRLEAVKEGNQRERNRTLDKAGIRFSERKDAKIVKKSDGTTQVYSGGIGKGDGAGHGHVALDQSGRKTYERAAFAKHGEQNFVNGKRAGWTKLQHGIILGKNRDHEVTFKQGIGKNNGQTLIADGHITDKQLRSGHNHYGPNDKSRYPTQPDRIEDSNKHKGDNYYTGPNH